MRMMGNQGSLGLIGQVISGYRLEKVLGAGGMGVVFLGRQERDSEQTVAVKILVLPPQSSEAERAEVHLRFMREAQLLFILRHTHILPIEAFGEDQATGYAYMILPYLAGGALAERLNHGPLPLDVAAQYATQVADALDYAHAHGIVHRDIKPANILLDENGQLLLADFGIARIFEAVGTGLTMTGLALGTPAYMAPEQIRGEHVGPPADIYSLGVLIYEMATGRLPFEGATRTSIMLKHVQEAPPHPRLLRTELPEPAEAAILIAMEKIPASRYATAGELAHAFQVGLQGKWVPRPTPKIINSLEQSGSNLSPASPKPLAPTPGSRSRRSLVYALLTLALVVALTGAVLFHQSQIVDGTSQSNGSQSQSLDNSSGQNGTVTNQPNATTSAGAGSSTPGAHPTSVPQSQATVAQATTVPASNPQISTHYVHGVVTQPNGLVATTASCDPDEVLVGGGANVDGTLYSSYPASQNSWTAEGSGSYVQQSVDAYAVCVSGLNNLSTFIMTSSAVAISGGGDARTTCPSGSILVSGGYQISPPPTTLFGPSGQFTVIVTGSTPMIGQNGWDVYAFGDSAEQLQTYVVCSQNGFQATSVETATASIGPLKGGNVVDSCPGSTLPTAGGGADLTMTSNQSMSIEGLFPSSDGMQWRYRPYNYQDSTRSHVGQIYVVCAST